MTVGVRKWMRLPRKSVLNERRGRVRIGPGKTMEKEEEPSEKARGM